MSKAPMSKILYTQIRQYVIAEFLKTGDYVFISDIAAKFTTNAATVRKALDFSEWDYITADKPTKNQFMASKDYIQSPAVYPSRETLRALINQLKGADHV